MTPLVINFAPHRAWPAKAGWVAGGASALLVTVSSVAWLLAAPVEASHMAERAPQPLPDVAETQAIEVAVRTLNLPWLDVLDALAATFGENAAAVLFSLEVDVPRAVLRLGGAARDAGAVQALPVKLRAALPVAEARLVSQELREDGVSRPAHFVIEMRLPEGS